MSKGKWRTRYREGACPTFGRVRPVHLHELKSIERKTVVKEDMATMMVRLSWNTQKSLSVPKSGDYISLHERAGKSLLVVDRVSKSCVCCSDRALTFIHASNVEGAVPPGIDSDMKARKDRMCSCMRARAWEDSATWTEAPETGLCRKTGSSSLLKISEAIKAKGERRV